MAQTLYEDCTRRKVDVLVHLGGLCDPLGEQVKVPGRGKKERAEVYRKALELFTARQHGAREEVERLFEEELCRSYTSDPFFRHALANIPSIFVPDVGRGSGIKLAESDRSRVASARSAAGSKLAPDVALRLHQEAETFLRDCASNVSSSGIMNE
eukprot:GHVU01085593.1.p2 GENE.GHVU01085593.1~~GHVU01085593.1.p2  ORF type:complete len:170 (-),score=33.47 GHVU01085593.1:597-1061(-)